MGHADAGLWSHNTTIWSISVSQTHNGFYLGDNAGSEFQVGNNRAKEVIWNVDKNQNLG